MDHCSPLPLLLAPSARREIETRKDEPRTKGAFIQCVFFPPAAVMCGVGVPTDETNNSNAEIKKDNKNHLGDERRLLFDLNVDDTRHGPLIPLKWAFNGDAERATARRGTTILCSL